jgi:hypothetical protein
MTVPSADRLATNVGRVEAALPGASSVEGMGRAKVRASQSN